MFEARDMELMVQMAYPAGHNSGRRVDLVHLAGPRDLRSEDDRFFEPLIGLDVADTRVFLGIVLPVDGVEGLGAVTLRRRGTSPTSASPSTAGLVASPARTGLRRCAGTATWSPTSCADAGASLPRGLHGARRGAETRTHSDMPNRPAAVVSGRWTTARPIRSLVEERLVR